MAEINQELVEKILGKKNKSRKAEEILKYKNEIIELRKLGLSMQDICFYLRKEHGLKVSTQTLKTAIPELAEKIKQFEKLIANMFDEELKQAYFLLNKELEKRGMTK
jgi:intein-encoded DNA endonuclease-like protein